MWKFSVNFLTNFMFLCAILFNVHLINTEIVNGDNVNVNDNNLETNLPDLMPNETSLLTISSIEEQQKEENTTNTIPDSTTQIQDQITTEPPKIVEYNIKHEISNPPIISAIESQMTESSNTQFWPITQIVQMEMDELPAVIKVQKCCPKGEIMVLGQPGIPSECQKSNEIFDLPVFCANLTHYWNCTSTAASNIEIVPRNPCEQRYFLNPNDEDDTFRVLSNTSLYIPYSMDMVNTDKYCVDTLVQGSETFTTAVICTAPLPKFPYIIEIIYLAGLGLSIIFLLLLAIYSSRRTDIKDDHKKCLTYFASSMATALIFEFFQKILNSYFNFYLNVVILYIIYYLKLNYYLWLNMLSYDTYLCVRDDSIKKSYMKYYLIATILIPFIFLCLSFIGGFIPPLPYKYSWFLYSSSLLPVILLYILPVALSTLANIIIICSLSLPKERYKNVKDLVATLQSKDWKAPPRNIKEIKRMYYRSLVLFIFMCACFVLDVILYFVDAHFALHDGFYCLQGFLVTCIFIKKCCTDKTNNRDQNNAEESQELQPMTDITVKTE